MLQALVTLYNYFIINALNVFFSLISVPFRGVLNISIIYFTALLAYIYKCYLHQLGPNGLDVVIQEVWLEIVHTELQRPQSLMGKQEATLQLTLLAYIYPHQ